ncbi:hypothetical protein HOY80DRAFT_186327 [Tuber brumale]|nr:hypothetical protein HOY80DRAFT_186327 [Tuber brumale]
MSFRKWRPDSDERFYWIPVPCCTILDCPRAIQLPFHAAFFTIAMFPSPPPPFFPPPVGNSVQRIPSLLGEGIPARPEMSCTILSLLPFSFLFGENFFGSLLSDANGGGICGCPIETLHKPKKNKKALKENKTLPPLEIRRAPKHVSDITRGSPWHGINNILECKKENDRKSL